MDGEFAVSAPERIRAFRLGEQEENRNGLEKGKEEARKAQDDLAQDQGAQELPGRRAHHLQVPHQGGGEEVQRRQ